MSQHTGRLALAFLLLLNDMSMSGLADITELSLCTEELYFCQKNAGNMARNNNPV